MKKIAFVTNATRNCGIHQYGRTVHRVLAGSSQHDYVFVTTPGAYNESFGNEEKIAWTEWLQHLDCDAILYNHCPTTMGWLDQTVVAAVNKPQFMITGHDDLANIAGIKHHFVTNPLFESTATHSALCRPLVLDHDFEYAKPGDVIKIGTFGLAYSSKRLPLLVQYVNESFAPSQQVELNIHTTVGAYTAFSETLRDHTINTCRAFARPNVKIAVTTDFVESIDELIAKLNHNDVNVFLYNNEPHRFAVSSALDLALSAHKPIAISNSSMFAHTTHVNSIVVDTDELQYYTGKHMNWLPDILEQGMAPLDEFYTKWSPENFRQVVESKL